MAMTVTIEGVEQLRQKYKLLLSDPRRKAMMEHMGRYVLEKVKDHLDTMSVSRHTVADRLGAKHTRYLEFASGRAGGTNENGERQDVVMKPPTDTSVTISIQNTPGLRRAFGPITITPKRARALTIPIHRISYGKRVADLRASGHDIFRLGKKNILAESDGAKRVRPLYCLVKRVTVPKDAGLLPSIEDYKNWGYKAVKGFMRTEAV